MLEVADNGFEQRRQASEPWGQFVGIAERIDGQDSYGDIRRTMQIIRIGRRLNATELDKNYYYAIGLVVCEFAKIAYPILADETQRESIVQDGAEAMLEAYYDQFVPSDEDDLDAVDHSTGNTKGLSLINANGVLEPIFDEAVLNLPRPVRLVGSCLAESLRNRTPGISPKLIETYDRVSAQEILGGDESRFLGRIGSNIFAGLSAMELIVDVRHDIEGIESHLPQQADIDLLRDPSALRLMRGISATVPMLNLSSALIARNVRFQDDTHKTLKPFDWEGEAQRRKRHIDKRSKSMADYEEYLLRDDAIVCPGTKIPIVFPMMTGLAIDMFDRARQLSE